MGTLVAHTVPVLFHPTDSISPPLNRVFNHGGSAPEQTVHIALASGVRQHLTARLVAHANMHPAAAWIGAAGPVLQNKLIEDRAQIIPHPEGLSR